MTSGVGVVDGKTGMNLSDGVGLGLTLAVNSEASIVGVSCGVGVVDGEASMNLADGVGLGLGLTLAIDSVDAMTSNLGVATNSGVHSGNTSVSVDSSHGG